MRYMLIKNVLLNKILIKNNNNNYKLQYKTNHSILSGISIRLYGITIKDNDISYTITINNKESLEKLTNIESHLINKLNINPILKDNSFILNKNYRVSKLMKKYSDTIDINIFLVKKVAYQSYPLVYVL